MAPDLLQPTAPGLGAVNRVGNSYSGGNVSGRITVNGQAPRGTFSSIGLGAPTSGSASAAPAPPAAAPAPAPAPFNPASGVGRPNVLGSLADTNAQIASLQSSYGGAPGLGARPPAAPLAPAVPLGAIRPAVAAAAPVATPAIGVAPAQQFFSGGGQAPQSQPVAPAAPVSSALAPPQPQPEKVQSLRDGGVVRGPGTGTSDAIPAMLSNGEAVLPEDTVRALGAENVQAAIEATHQPAGAPQMRDGYPAFADGGVVTEEELRRRAVQSAPAPGGDVMGRRPTIDMGMAQEVPRTALPTAQPTTAVSAQVPNSTVTQTTPSAPSSEVIGRRPSINMGAAYVVQPARVAAQPSAAALAGPEAAAASRSMLGRVAGPAGVALGVGLEGKQIYDVATNPSATGIDVAAQAAQGVGRLSAAGAGAGAGAAAGSVLGPVGTAVGGVVGGGLGYLAADRAIAAGRSALGSDPRAPVDRLAAAAPAAEQAPTESGGAAFGIYPRPSSQRSTNANDAALQRGVQATGPSTFVPATPAVAPPAAAPQRLTNLTDPRSTQYQGGADSSPPSAPATNSGDVPQPAAPAAVPVAPAYQSAGTVSQISGASDAERLAQLNRDIAFQTDKQTWRNPNDPSPGLAVIDNPGPAAAQAMFDGANLRTVLARGAPPGRNGAQVFAQQVDAALNPIQQRNAAAALVAREGAETQRSLIQERAANARTRAQTQQQQDANSIDRARLSIDAIRAGQAGVPVGYRWKADGSGGLEPIPGGNADPNTPRGKNTLNDTQAKALQFGSRMQASEAILDKLAVAGVNQPGLIKRGADAVGLGAAANWTQSAEQQQVEQAQRDFINAALRRESGAAIADSEFANARQQYFPQPGDSAEVIAQKKLNRELATRGILAEVPDGERRLSQVAAPATTPPTGLPQGMSRQVGTAGGKPVYEDAQGRRFIGG